MTSPAIRASYAQENVRALAQLLPPTETAVRTRAAREIAEVMAAGRLAWLPIELDLAILEAIAAVGGESELRAHARAALLASTETPLLRPIRDGALRLLGARPENIFKWAPNAWGISFRACGVVSWEHLEPEHGVIRVRELPPLLFANRPWALTAAGAFEGGVELGRGRAAQVDVAVAGTELRYDIRWQPLAP